MTPRRRLLLAAAVLGLPWVAFAQPALPPAGEARGQPTLRDDKETIEAGEQWLKLIDAGKIGEAWDASAATLKSAVSRQQWIAGLRDARKPFGKLTSRKATRFARAHSMPNAPDGDYAIIEFEAVFANGRKATEHLTWMLEDGDAWRVAGYYIR